MLLNIPRPAVEYAAQCILRSRKEDDHLTSLGAFFEQHLIRIMLSQTDSLSCQVYTKGQTPAGSGSSTIFYFKKAKEVKINIEEVLKIIGTRRTASALIQDGYRCVVTSIHDLKAPWDILSAAEESPDFRALNILNYSTSLLAILQQLGYDIETFNGEKVHSLIYVMIMEKDLHDWSCTLKGWWVSLRCYLNSNSWDSASLQSAMDLYQVKTFRSWRPNEYTRQYVQFTTPDPEHLPAPTPQPLTLHAACCKFAHFSGAHLEIYGDVKETGVLSHDGRSKDILTYAVLLALDRNTNTHDA
ncbi:hypothetical protein BOTBODRAFT_146500 [Botryobasidium botryosum FD-172 SS1]|uniref:Uncharacterized protein n=1 Tax=Botryobasidium botryosum (strain FD-172 SS1) TaxID=930990 RepID=A0A067MA93_BOTB1|nr:hypothetical protein BOTBODRAFT_146500 [Botryobasidium botryosum FD-172 SS1]